MKNIFTIIFLWVAIAFIQLSAGEDSACKHSGRSCGKNEQCVSHEFIVSPQDLVFDQEDIFINLEGILFPIQSLKRHDSQWKAMIDFGKNVGYCPRGDDLCRYCELCHRSGCYYYVEPCWRR